MAQIEKILEEKTISFQGLFSLKKVREVIEKWADKNNYDIVAWQDFEKKEDEENINVQSQIKLEKEISDYAKLRFIVMITTSNLKKKRVKVKGKDYRVVDGKIDVEVEGYIIRDYAKKWSKSSISYFFRFVADKFLFKTIVSKWEEQLSQDYKEMKKMLYEVLNFD